MLKITGIKMKLILDICFMVKEWEWVVLTMLKDLVKQITRHAILWW